jgi:hypothetical protein
MGAKVTEAQAPQIIEEAAATYDPMHLSADGLARYVGLRYRDRARLKITTIGACDLSKKQREDLRRQRDRLYQQQKRRAAGARPRSQSLSQTRPWEAEQISRRTWERRRKKARDANSSAAILINAADESATEPSEPIKRAASLRSAASALAGGKGAQTRTALRAARLIAVDEALPELPESPVAPSAARDAGNGFRLPGGPRWRPAGDDPEATAIVFIKEVWPPALGPPRDDVFDLGPGWAGR